MVLAWEVQRLAHGDGVGPVRVVAGKRSDAKKRSIIDEKRLRLESSLQGQSNR